MSNKSALVAFYVGKGLLFNYLIRAYQWLCGDTYWRCSHVEIFMRHDKHLNMYLGASSSAMDNGVRAKYIKLTENWETLPVEIDRAKVEIWLREHYGQKFDWLGILGQIWGRVKQAPDKWYCNESVQAMCGFDTRRMRPAQFYEYLLMENADERADEKDNVFLD